MAREIIVIREILTWSIKTALTSNKEETTNSQMNQMINQNKIAFNLC